MNPQSPHGPTLPAPQAAPATGNPLGVPSMGPLPGGAYAPTPGQPEPQLSPSAVEAGITTEDIQTMGAPEGQAVSEGEGMDKLWEIRAKQIILATATDPFMQHQQLMHLKAEFMQKQYNKTIKLS